MNPDGIWNYMEDFGYGKSFGTVEIKSANGIISGIFQLREESEGEAPFEVELKARGKIEDNHLKLQATDYKITKGDPEMDYQLDSWDGQIINDQLIVGEAEDAQGVLGIFTFKREKA
ncbi:hypothetical protein [Persicobacter diffluens]|uniref:Uncharacterized protein n=1 Tax=Persicobacter diffluens TaxID=981 RepID=A0AAN4W1T7_9BACT|nr:hypothetical protein PEDI_40690 [Persicobacter diffluens]